MKKRNPLYDKIKNTIEIPAAFLGSSIGQLGSVLLEHIKFERVVVNIFTGWLLGFCAAWLIDRLKPATTETAKKARLENWPFRFAIAASIGFFGMVVASNGPQIIQKVFEHIVGH